MGITGGAFIPTFPPAGGAGRATLCAANMFGGCTILGRILAIPIVIFCVFECGDCGGGGGGACRGIFIAVCN